MNPDIVEDLRTVHSEVTTGVAAALDGIEAALAAMGSTPPSVEDARDALVAALQALSFDDLCGQRLNRVIEHLTGHVDIRPDADLLNGPARGSAPGQDAVDVLFGD